MSQDIIIVSSDEEYEPPLKKVVYDTTGSDLLGCLNHLTTIKARRCDKRNSVIKFNKAEKNLEAPITIIIADENNKQNGDQVYNLEDSVEESAPTKEDYNVNNDCLIVQSDSELETAAKDEENKSDPIGDQPSTSSTSEKHKLLEIFLDVCTKTIKGSKFESKILPVFPKLRKHFDKCASIHSEPNFKKLLMEYTANAKKSAAEAVISFQRVYSYLRSNVDSEFVEVTDLDLRKLRKLEKTCKILMRRIRKLEEAEVNFDDEDDSVYIQMDRYQKRLNKVHAKYCQVLKRNPKAGRLLYDKFYFMHSQYNEINRAITKSYKHNKFPSYSDIEKIVRECVQKNNLSLREDEIKDESKRCFAKMGDLLQMRRKKELYEVHCNFITSSEDPANTDENLKNQLQDSKLEGEKKMKEVIDKYAKLQENNIKIDLSEDSDDSHYKNSDSETES